MRPREAIFFKFYYLDFMLGLAKLYRSDSDAESYLQSYTLQFGGRHYLKEAYQKIAWSRLLAGDKLGYEQYLQRLLKKGVLVLESDKKAQKEAQGKRVPQPDLLRARLLFDGGYSDKAQQCLEKLVVGNFADATDQTEFLYRMGRIAQKKNELKKALGYYSQCYAMGGKLPAYFACSAALQSGIIYEETQNKAMARVMYGRCLGLQPEDYGDSLHQKAKAGLARLR